ncbi:MAG TPA: site-specific integrase [Actinomycetota bacterium]|nr:site-specific integrase [Actinomycetota bacterium]
MAWKERRGHGYRVVDRGPDGKKVTLSDPRHPFAKSRDADAFIATIEADKSRGIQWIDPRAGQVPFAEYAERFIETKADVSRGTLDNIKGRIRTHLNPSFGAMPMNAIQTSDIRAWQAAKKGTRAADTINSAFRTLDQIFELAKEDRLRGENPCDRIRPLRKDSRRAREIHPLTPEQVGIFADAIAPRYRAFVLFSALGTGMRPGESWALRVPNVNWLRRQVHVVESADEGNVGPTKTGRRRTIRIDEATAELLARHVEEYPSPDGFVFTSPEGKMVRHRNFLADHFDPAREKVRHLLPPGFCCYDLRHTFASLLISRGARIEQVADRLGHASVRTTLDWYSHLFEGHDDELLADLAGLVREASAPTVPPPSSDVVAMGYRQVL